MNFKKRITAALLVMVFALQLCGFSLYPSTIAVDANKNRVYRYIGAEKVLEDFGVTGVNAFFVYGTISEISSDGAVIKLSGSDGAKLTARCSDHNIRSDILKYKPGDEAALYGYFETTMQLTSKPNFHIEKIVRPPKSVMSGNICYTLDGTGYDCDASLERTLSDGRVKYRIPSSWKNIELDIKSNDLGTIEGYQYVLNKMPGRTGAEPESFFVCYFDKKLLRETSDIRNSEGVEKVIIENITGSAGLFPFTYQTTYYGAACKYCAARYTDAMETGKGYRVEYIFREDGDRGIVMCLYVYREANYLSDVLFVNRFLVL